MDLCECIWHATSLPSNDDILEATRRASALCTPTQCFAGDADAFGVMTAVHGRVDDAMLTLCPLMLVGIWLLWMHRPDNTGESRLKMP